MKPPSRHRIVPKHLLPSKGTEPTRKFCNGWGKHEQRNLLNGLMEQQRLNSELDLLELRKKVPKRTLLEIQNVIKSLKTRVVRRVHQQVQKQKCEERKNKAPIEIWAELAQKMAGVHEETISSAFSQMLVIAATEPCSRQHSDPPRFFNTQSPVANNLLTNPRSRSGCSSRLPSSFSPGGTCEPSFQSHRKGETSSPSCKNTVQSSSISSIEEGSDCPQPRSVAGQGSEKPSTPSIPKSNFCQLTSSKNHAVSKRTLPLHTTRAVSSAEVSSSKQMNKQDKSGQSEQDHQPRPTGVECKVDFEKIYQFMSNINTNKHNLALTAMESAVLLDLLMSLPEELPLLDCKELQHHLLQVHTRLTTPPVNTSSVPRTDQRPADAKLVMSGIEEKETAAAAKGTDASLLSAGEPAKLLLAVDNVFTKSVINPSKNWAEVGLCPLNPFIVPVGLLKRQQS